MHKCNRTLTALIAIALTAGCSGGSGGSDGFDGSGSTGGTASPDTGLLSLSVSDGPVHDAKKVCISFNAIEVHGAGQTTILPLDDVAKINLLEFQGMNAAPLIVDEVLDAGDYQWLRLGIDAERGANGGAGDTGGDICDGEASYVVTNGNAVYNLYVPSGSQNGLKLVSGFTVPANGSADFTVEFDLMKSIKAPPGQAPDLKLRPALRMVNNIEAGTLTGMVDPALATADGCEPAVFLFDDGVMPNPIDDIEPADPEDPVATAMVNEQDAGNGTFEYHYTIGYLLPGEYEAAFTCDGNNFEPMDGIGVAITANKVSMQDF